MPKIYTARELAAMLASAAHGDGSIEITGLARPEDAGPGDLIYLDSPRHESRVAGSAARCLLARPGTGLAGKTVIEAAEPKLAFAKAAALLFAPGTASEAFSPAIPPGVHASAVVAPGARIGARAAIGPCAVIEDGVEIAEGCVVEAFCYLGRNTRVGAACRLHPRVTIYPGARLGHRVELHSGVVIGGDGFGYVFGEGRHWKFPQVGSIEIGDEVEIGCNSTVDRGSLGKTIIGAGTKIDNLVHVGHNVRIGEHCVIAAETGISGSCAIGHRVMIGGQAGLGEGCVIEDGAIIGGQAGVLPGKRIRAGQIVWGTPARPFSRFKRPGDRDRKGR